MRLWHEALIPYLPRQQLLGQHRECCSLRGLGWGKPHSVVNYVFDHPREWLYVYHVKVMDEMHRRSYKVTPEWYNIRYNGKAVGFSGGFNQIAYVTAANKKPGVNVYPEHDDAYLQECLDNLARKGVKIDMGVRP